MLAQDLPYWQDYRELLRQLGVSSDTRANLPDTLALNELVINSIQQESGKAIRFVPADELSGVAYEEHIYRTGEISTRQDSWHDLFNALVWARFPLTKASMNASHYTELSASSKPERGPVRDALTLFDECGVVVIGDQLSSLQALAHRDWNTAFCKHRQAWQEHLGVLVLGHALLEKFLDPNKAITAQVLFLEVSADFMWLDRATQRDQVDTYLAQQVEAGHCLRSSRELSPLPLMGIPGWWQQGEQDDIFYADEDVFRPPASGFLPPAVQSIELKHEHI